MLVYINLISGKSGDEGLFEFFSLRCFAFDLSLFSLIEKGVEVIGELCSEETVFCFMGVTPPITEFLVLFRVAFVSHVYKCGLYKDVWCGKFGHKYYRGITPYS